MYLAYTDESGDSGYKNSPTKFFVVSCLLINEINWFEILNNIVALRRTLKRTYGIPIRIELKAEHLVHGRGIFRELGMTPSERIELYEKLLKFEAEKLCIRVFAIAIDKEKIQLRDKIDPRATAWQYLTQRLDVFCDKQQPVDRVMLLPDEGNGFLVKRIVRKARRHQVIKGLYGGTLDIKERYLIEDPFDKKSSESYFIQLADWNAYAAHRYKEIAPNNKVPNDLWNSLKPVFLNEVNELTGGPSGIVLWPRT
jgi:hypothetical protein